MRDVIFSLLHEHLYLHVLLISICVAAMLVAMGVDLFFGIRKAKMLGQVTTSTGYKKTAEKGRKYFMPFAVLMMIDIIGCIILPAPFFAMIWAAWCIFCEFKSVREKAWTKAELRRAERTMNIIIENKDDIAGMIKEMVFAQTEAFSGTEGDGTLANKPDISSGLSKTSASASGRGPADISSGLSPSAAASASTSGRFGDVVTE